MGLYLNRGNQEFRSVVNSKIYVDKTDMISYLNSLVNTEQRYVCVTRPRRFGKSITANMIAAYYERGCNSFDLFQDRKLSQYEDWDCKLNQYDTIRIDLAEMRAKYGSPEETLSELSRQIYEELKSAYPEIVIEQSGLFTDALAKINEKTGIQFVVIIDEWDCFFRDEKSNREIQMRYIDLLRGLFKGNMAKNYLALAYITGILPVKRYNSESALNNFDEYTMIHPRNMSSYLGFTEDEVRALCRQYDMSFEQMSEWYDGYQLGENSHVYNPNSVVKALMFHEYEYYWSQTVAFTSLVDYITMDFEGLREAVLSMLGGQREEVWVGNYANDMTSFASKDDVLTVLIHLGYLGYDAKMKEAYIANKETRYSFECALRGTGWSSTIESIRTSKRLLDLTLQGNEKKVAELIDEAHRGNTSILRYNDENSLAAVIALAYYSAKDDYVMVREMPSGYGFADMVFLPKKGVCKPALVVELKWNKNAETAIDQIKDKKYAGSLKDYTDDIVLVGINYDKEKKHHVCMIEKWKLT